MGRLILTLSILLSSGFAQGILGQQCAPPGVKINSKVPNMFTPQQEMDLGEAMLDRIRNEYGVIDAVEINARLQQIGDNLSRFLPASGIRYRFMVADLPDTNAFAFPGGHIVVTRKMINFARSETELAGIVAHELGHAVVRHGGIDMTRRFKDVLQISAVGDRKDVFDKYNLWIERRMTRDARFSDDHESDQQLEADRIGMYALIAAGYDGGTFANFWSRFTLAKKRGFFSDLFGLTSPADKRLREMLDQLKRLPAECRQPKHSGIVGDFEKWRASVISYSPTPNAESIPGLIKRSELTPLRSDIDHLQFSPNGQFILAQDSSTITVVKREPLAVMFQIPAEGSRPASFSQDSTEIVLINTNLHVQRWSVSERKILSDHEVSVPLGYWQTKLSPNGEVLAAYLYSGDIVLYDVRTNNEIFREKDFYLPTLMEYYMWLEAIDGRDDDEATVLTMKFSPDNKYFLAARDFTVPFYVAKEEFIAVNMDERKKTNVGDNIKRLMKASFGFLSADRVVGRLGEDLSRSGVFSFPAGDRLEQFELGGLVFTKATSGNHLAVWPVTGSAAVGIFDLNSKKYVFASKKLALDIFDGTVVAERKNGEIALYSIGRAEAFAALELPKSEFGPLRTASFSDDGSILVASDRSRGAVWDMRSGERKFHLRTFRGHYVNPEGQIYADFPAVGDSPRSIARMNPANGSIEATISLKEGNVRQYGRYLLERKPLKAETEKKDNEKEKERRIFSAEEDDKWVGATKTSFEIRDAVSGATLWKRDFRKETPAYYLSTSQDSLTLTWWLDSDAAREIIGSDPGLQEKARAMKDPEGDLFVEVLDPATGHLKGRFFLETGRRSFIASTVMAADDYLIVADNFNRILVHSITTGKLIHRFFGSRMAISPKVGLIVVENVPGRLAVFELSSGRQIDTISLRKGAVSLRFSPNGKQIFILTRDQVAYTVETAKIGKN